jgi:uncharacterized damage-inducible protein DinB
MKTSTGKAGGWRAIVASSIDWEQAHTTFDHAIEGLPAALRGRRAKGFPHSTWELVEHIRLAQEDLLAFMTDDAYKAPKWPDDYWPRTPAPSSAAAWSRSLAAVRRALEALRRFTADADVDLTAKIPWGDGQTYLRTILVAVDHNAYHVGQIVAVRRLLGAWGTR